MDNANVKIHHNWYYRLTPGIHPFLCERHLTVTSATFLGSSYLGSSEWTLRLHYVDPIDLDNHSDQANVDDIPLQTFLLGRLICSQTPEIELDLELESNVRYAFELTSTGSSLPEPIDVSTLGCTIVLLGHHHDGDTSSQTSPDQEALHDRFLKDSEVPYVEEGDDALLAQQDLDDVRIDDLSFAGVGVAVGPGDVVLVWYKAHVLESGVVYQDVNASNGPPAMFRVGSGEVIQGWDEGMIGMRAGGTRLLTIPAHKAYGADGNGNKVPPNSTIVIKCKLLGVSERFCAKLRDK